MATKQKTAPSTPRLSEYARRFVYPQGITRTVWPRVEAKGQELGLGFDWWQSQLGTVCLGYDASGKYVATVGGIGMSIPRQVGKTYFVLTLLVIMCILFPGLQVVWTAHHLRTSTKTFTHLRGICRRRRVAPHIKALRAANGEQQAEFVNGSMIMFGSRARGFGRGFDEVDVEVFDEAQILDTKSLEDMIAATNQARHEHGALLFFMGTPPRQTDPSEAFTARRTEAWSGETEDAIWLELGADPESHPDDRSQFPVMNPSYPLRTPPEALDRLRRNLKDPDSWNREGRGVWDDLATARPSIFGSGRWESTATTDVHPQAPAAIGVAVSVDRLHASIAAASIVDITPAEDPEAEPVERVYVAAVDRRPGVAWLVDEVKRIQDEHDCSVVIDEKGPTKDLLKDLEEADVAVEPVTLDQYAEACSRFFDKVQVGGILRPAADPDELDELTEAVSGVVWRTVGDRQVWGRRKSESDVSMLEAATLAAHAAEMVGAFNIG